MNHLMLNLFAATTWIALAARVRRARQHRVLGGEPALVLADEKRRHTVLDARRAQHPRVPELDQRGAFGVLLKAGNDFQRAELIGTSTVESHRAHPTVHAPGALPSRRDG